MHELIISIFFFIGILLIFIPPEYLIRFDKRSGYRIYKKSLEQSGSKTEALQAAGKFYKLFGMAFIIFGLSFIYFQ